MDWMHTLCSSGGLGQYELNQFLRRLKAKVATGLQPAFLAQLDAFRNQVAWPKREPRHASLEFQERMVDKPGKHVRMFAAECMQSILALCLYVELQPEVRTKLPEETECLQLLGRILYLLRSGRMAVQKVDLLDRLVCEHHDRFVQLDGQHTHAGGYRVLQGIE